MRKGSRTKGGEKHLFVPSRTSRAYRIGRTASLSLSSTSIHCDWQSRNALSGIETSAEYKPLPLHHLHALHTLLSLPYSHPFLCNKPPSSHSAHILVAPSIIFPGFWCGDCKHCVSYFTVSRLASICLNSISSNTSPSSSHIIVSCETLNLWWKASFLK
ncbi:uncharacterized protein AKAW2_10530S [Aspergillus luchuensis]|uniref:Uncharacterized protein n=1 Tax=Aspergillus kawachii TaxID=1069201 RepID=A0A7R7ZU85_ASPKA|nr:uncharacterized protein AKAW2_10530S [Aspergillus luchuensis]BCR93484.1 hypothetical protein AKAW2_10530S [Aspergillus luchuensis]